MAPLASRGTAASAFAPSSARRERNGAVRNGMSHAITTHLFRWRLDERRVESAQRARSRNAIRDDRDPGRLSMRWIATDDQDMRGKPAKHRELPVENRRGTDRQRALVASAETPGAAAGQDCC